MSANMLIDNHKLTILNLMRDGEALLRRIGDTERAQHILEARAETERKENPTIMFYGLYNAGKSTLINALCKKEIAKTGDVPTTAKIQAVPWEGYTLLDTPGIDAQAAHTAVAEEQIRQSDLILFVMDNADTFDNARVYQAIVAILKMGKPLAIVINQKNMDEDEDANLPIAEQSSIKRIMKKVSVNLEQYSRQNNLAVRGRGSNFLGIFPVNARYAAQAGGEDLLYQASGVISLGNAINDSIRRSRQIYLLRTPLIDLRETLQDAIKAHQSAEIYGDKQQLARNRDSLMTSRQRLRERLLADGLRKIDMAMEEMKTAAANNQRIEDMGQKLSTELNRLLKDAAGQEQSILYVEIKMDAMPDCPLAVGGGSAHEDEPLPFDLGDLGKLITSVTPILIAIPEVLPVGLIMAAAGLIIKLFGKTEDTNTEARRNQEQLANYYKWLNELRDQEVKIKANYETTVNAFLEQYYDPKLEQIHQALAAVDNDCAEHTRNLRAMEQLLLCVGDEMASLAVSVP